MTFKVIENLNTNRILITLEKYNQYENRNQIAINKPMSKIKDGGILFRHLLT